MNKSRVISPVLLTCAAALASVALSAGDEVDKTLAASGNGLVKIDNTRGKVEIIGWDKDEIHITGELDDLAEELIFEVKGDRALIKVKLSQRNINWGDGSDLEIHLPRGSRVDFDGVSTDTRVVSVLGGLRARSISGFIRAGEIENQVQINTVSGDIDVTDASGKVRIATVSGDVHLEMTSSDAVFDTVSGDIEAEFSEFSSLRSTAVSGDVEVRGKLTADGTVEMSSVSGDITFEVLSPVSGHLSIHTGVGGDITNNLSDHEPNDRFPFSKELEASLGDGSANIRLHTVSGDIRIDD